MLTPVVTEKDVYAPEIKGCYSAPNLLWSVIVLFPWFNSWPGQETSFSLERKWFPLQSADSRAQEL